MSRGTIWTVSGAAGFAGKPRPAVIIQDDYFEALDSVTVCLFTTDPTDAPIFRPAVRPDAANGLSEPSRLMVDKLATVPRSRLGYEVGRLAKPDLARLNASILVFLGLAGQHDSALADPGDSEPKIGDVEK